MRSLPNERCRRGNLNAPDHTLGHHIGSVGLGKSTALNVLEDLGFYSVDNLPASLTEPLLEKSKAHALPERIAISIDARNTPQDLEAFPEVLARIKGITLTIVFLDARTATLIQRFSETRRKHPLSTAAVDLKKRLSENHRCSTA